MAIGDLKGPECVVVEVTAGATVTVGQVVHIESDDGKWNPCATTDTGKFGVALDAADDTETMRVCIWGRVETISENTSFEFQVMMSGATGYVTPTDDGSTGENVGTMMQACASLGTGTLWVGLVG